MHATLRRTRENRSHICLFLIAPPRARPLTANIPCSTLVRINLTTDEQRHLGKVDYLMEPNGSGQYYNPFDFGCAGNCTSRFWGTYDNPPAELMRRLSGPDPVDSEMANFV